MSDGELFAATMRRSLAAFIAKSFAELDGGVAYDHNWHIDLVADALTRAFRGETAESGSTRTPIPVEGGHCNGDCGQQVMAA